MVFVVAEAETARVTLFDGGDIMYGNHVNKSLDLIDGEGGGCRRGRDEAVRVREREREMVLVEGVCGPREVPVRGKRQGGEAAGEKAKSSWT